MSDLQDLIPVVPSTIGTEPVQTINARDLHKFLESKQEFSPWIKHRIAHYGFTQDVDFAVIDNFIDDATAFGGKRKMKEHYLSLDMAKELAMVERNVKGKEARQYFIACEKFAQESLRVKAYSPPMPLLPSTIGRTMIEDMLSVSRMVGVPESYALQIAASQATIVTGLPWDRLLTQAPAMSDVPDDDVLLEPTELGRLFGLSPIAMNKKLEEVGLQKRSAGQWVPTEEGAPLCTRHAWTRGAKTGYNLKWRAVAIEERLGITSLDDIM